MSQIVREKNTDTLRKEATHLGKGRCPIEFDLLERDIERKNLVEPQKTYI